MSTSEPQGPSFELCQFEIDRREPCLLARGEIDLSNAHEFAAALIVTARPGSSTVLDMSGVSFMDSTGLQTLVEHRLQGHSFTVRNPSPCVARLLDLTAIDGIVAVDRTP